MQPCVMIQEGGLRALVWPMQETRSVSIGFWFRLGSRDEPEAMHGVAHFIEHMLFKGTRRRSSAEISRAVEGRGGDLNAFTGEETTCYYARCSARHFDVVADVLVDMLTDSLIESDEVEREREVILEEIRMYQDQPAAVAQEILNEAIWPGQALGRSILGTAASLQNLRATELVNYWRQHYHPANMVLAVAGRIDPEQVRKRLKHWADRWQLQGQMVQRRPAVVRRGRSPVWVAKALPVQQVNVAMGFAAFGRKDPRRSILRVLSVILGENMSSRLFQELREKKGLVYSVDCQPALFTDAGTFLIHLGLESCRMTKAATIVGRELARMRRQPPPLAELKRARDYIIGHLEMGLESSMSRMLWMGNEWHSLGRLPDPAQMVSEFESVTSEQIRNLAGDLFRPGALTFAAAGPELTPASLKRDWSGLVAALR